MRTLLLSVLAGCLVLSPTFARVSLAQSTLGEKSSYIQKVLQVIASNWERSDVPNPCTSEAVKQTPQPKIRFTVLASGEITNTYVLRTTGFVASDLAALDAIWSSSPLAPPSIAASGPTEITCDFWQLLDDPNIKVRWASRNAYDICSFYIPGSEPSYTFRILPLAVIQRYPSNITEAQVMNSGLEKLRIGRAQLQLLQIRKDWERWFTEHRTATTDQILQHRDQVKTRYSTWFWPAEGIDPS